MIQVGLGMAVSAGYLLIGPDIPICRTTQMPPEALHMALRLTRSFLAVALEII